MPYCSNCGAQINQGVKFCSNCGNRIANPVQGTPPPPPPPPSYQPAPTGEPVLAAISGLKQGMLGRKNYVMLITNQRLVITELSGKDIKELNKQAKEQAKAEGAGLLGRMAAGLNATMNTGQLFAGMDVNEVLRKYPNTMQLPENTVNKLRINHQGIDNTHYDIEINASGFREQYRFNEYTKGDHHALKNLLGNRYSSTTHFL